MAANKMVEKLTSRFFRKVDDAVWDMTTGQLGLKSGDSILTLIGTDDKDAQVSENLFAAMSVPIPAFSQQLPLAQINFGDIIYGEKGALGWVTKKTAKSVTVMGKQGNSTTITPRKVAMLGAAGGDTLMVLRSLIAMTGGTDGLAGLQSSMLPMLMLMGDKEGEDSGDMLSTMLMMQFMGGASGQQAGGLGGMNPMMMLMMMKGKDFF